MNTILVLSFFVVAAYAGVIPWTREEEANARDLYKRYCSGRQDNGKDGRLSWHCKKSLEVRPRTVVHKHSLPPSETREEHLVFVETPADEYRHEVVITGQVNSDHKTKVVVIPAIDKHNFDVKTDIQTNVQSSKPGILYLRSNPNEPEIGSYGSGYGYDAPAPAPVPSRVPAGGFIRQG